MEFEFIEPHAVVGFGGQEWPVEHPCRDDEIAELIYETKIEVNRNVKK